MITPDNSLPTVSVEQNTEQTAHKIAHKTAATPIVVNGEIFDNWPQDLFIPPDALEVFLETFQGPLDFLLYLIRKQNLDILDIPVAKITKQYMEYVELMRQFRLDLAAEYLLMAATLAEIKSRMLLPPTHTAEEHEEDDPRAALVRRLQEYERFSHAGEEISQIPRLERELFLVTAAFDDPEHTAVQSRASQNARASLNDLVVAFRNIIERSELNRNWNVGKDGLTVREKMTHILDRIHDGKFIKFEDLFVVDEGRLGLVVSFMAILELVRDDMLIVVQNEPFSSIHLSAVSGQEDSPPHNSH